MNRFLAASVAVTALVALVTGCTSDTDTPDDGAGGGAATATGQQCDPALERAFAAWAEAGFSGTVTLTTAGEPDCRAAYGVADEAADEPNTVDTVFSIGSVTKAFTAAAVFHLVDEGKLSLADRAGNLVAGLAGPVADATVEQLLLHTSGLTGSHGADSEPLDHDAAVAALGRLELAFAPGTEFLYSNAGYTLLALIIEEASGSTYRDHTASTILRLPDGHTAGGFWNGEPAAPGPRAVGYIDDEGTTGDAGDAEGPYWATDGNGSLAMTTDDLAAWTHALFTGAIVSQHSADAIATPAFDQGDGTEETPGWVSFDADLYGEPALATAGGGGDVGHNAVVVWLPESERVLAMASNTAGVSAEELLQAIAPELVAGDPLPTPVGEVSGLDPDDVADIVGEYGLDTGGSFDVTTRDERLAVTASGTDAVAALFPLPDRYTADEVEQHEQHVSELLAGETQEGREEREVLESDIGPIDDIRLDGTIVDEGELRTYVTLTSGTGSTLLWYAVDEHGAIAAVEITDEPPTLLLAPTDDGGFRPDDPTGSRPDMTVTFTDGALAIDGPGGTTSARRET